LIEVRNISKEFKGKPVVKDVNFSVKSGEIFALLGPNGAGKTTTIRMMIGLLKPTKGQIWMDGLHVEENPKKIHDRIGVVFELPNLYVRWSIHNNLTFFANLYNVKKQRIDEVMESLQLIDKMSLKVETLSKGWKQRVLIARALLHKPKILFLDEPTSGLDPNTATLIRQYLLSLKREGTTVVITTHDMNEADQLSDKVGIMYNGSLVALDTPHRLKERFGKEELLVRYNRNGEEVLVRMALNTKETADFLAEKLVAKEIISIHSQEATLADVFAKLTGSELS